MFKLKLITQAVEVPLTQEQYLLLQKLSKCQQVVGGKELHLDISSNSCQNILEILSTLQQAPQSQSLPSSKEASVNIRKAYFCASGLSSQPQLRAQPKYVFLVLDDAFLFKSVKEPVQTEAQQEGTRCYTDYYLRGESFFSRPYLEEYLKSLLSQASHDTKVFLCMNIDRPRLVALSLQLLGSKKLKELRRNVAHFCD